MTQRKPDLSGFQCLGCGACCRQSGHVRVTDQEIEAIAAFLGMTVHDFIQAHTCLARNRQGLSLADKANGECFFLTEKGCALNPVKPAQCRDFPVKWRFSGFETVCAWARQEIRCKD